MTWEKHSWRLQIALMLYLHAECPQSRRLTLLTWSRKDSQVKLPSQSVMEPMMLTWSSKPMLELVSLEKKDNKQLEVPITLLVNSNFWDRYYLSMEESAIGETHSWFYTHFTRIFCMWLPNSSLDSTPPSQDRLFMSPVFISFITLQWHLYQSCGMLYLITNMTNSQLRESRE